MMKNPKKFTWYKIFQTLRRVAFDTQNRKNILQIMNLQNVQFLSILLFIFWSCNTKEDKRIETIEMLSNNDYVIFDTQINDKQGYFLFDTHSSVNVIYKKPWDTLEYKITGITKVNNRDAETVNIDSIVLGTAKYYNVEAVVIDDSNDTFKNMSGIIGINIDRKANWILDFENGIVEIHKTKLSKKDFDYFLKYKVNNRYNRLPYLNAKINKKDISLKIDTGYENELKISEKDFFTQESLLFNTKKPG